MALTRISENEYIALSTDIVDSKIAGLGTIGAKVFITDDQIWYIVEPDLTLSTYNLPFTIAGEVTIGSVTQGTPGLLPWLVDGSGVTQPVSGPVTYTELTSAPLEITGNVAISPTSIANDAGGRLRVSQLTTLGDYKILDADRTFLWENAGTGTGTFVANKFNMSVTSGQWYVRQTRRFHHYFSGKSQFVECTFDNFHVQSNVVKRLGYFSSNAASPFDSTYDGIYLENDGTTLRLKIDRAGTNTVNVAFADWDGYSSLASYNWQNFTVVLIDFLWLGGFQVRLWVKTTTGLVLAHTVNYAGSAQDVMMLSPNQPIRYEIRSSTGSGSFRYICAQVSTEGSINESGISNFVHTGTSVIALATSGVTYPIKSIRKLATYRDIMMAVEELSVVVSTANDRLLWSLQVNPTLSAPLTYSTTALGLFEEATGNGTITVTSPGILVTGGMLTQNVIPPNTSLKQNFLAFLGQTLNNTFDEYVLCGTCLTAGIDVNAGMLVKIY